MSRVLGIGLDLEVQVLVNITGCSMQSALYAIVCPSDKYSRYHEFYVTETRKVYGTLFNDHNPNPNPN